MLCKVTRKLKRSNLPKLLQPQNFLQDKSKWLQASLLYLCCFHIGISTDVRLPLVFFCITWPSVNLRLASQLSNLFLHAFAQTLSVGGLFSQFELDSSGDYAVDLSGVRRMAAAQMAINHVNDKSDNVYDHLLKDTRVCCRFSYM